MKKDFMTINDDMPKKSGGKGFYIALAVCMLAVCGVAVSSFVGGLTEGTPQTEVKETTPTTKTTVQQVVIPATDVKDDRTTTTSTRTTTIATTTTTAANLFVFPASNRVVSEFSDELVYSETLEEWGTHNGVDFAAETGSKVKAIAAGTVTKIYRDALWGDVVEIDHGGKVVSRCCGVKASVVTVGQQVKAGDVIGVVDEIPSEVLMESHVHLEVLANDNYVDPLLFIRAETVASSAQK